MRRGAVVALAAGALLATVLLASPVSLLTVSPPVYHDEYNLIAPAVAFTEDASLRMPLYDSTPMLERAFRGRGSFTPGLNAGFYVSLGLWFDAFGVGIRQARAFVYVLGLVVVIEVLLLGWRWWNLWVGAAAALLVALDGTFWYASRQVRPETFTMAAFLGAASLLSIADVRRRSAWAPLAGTLFGLGLTGHPVGAAAAPVVILVPFISTPPGAREKLRFLAPALAIVLAYGVFLFVHREGVLANLRLHAEQRALGTAGLTEVMAREALRYGERYWSGFAQGLGRTLIGAVWAGWGVLGVAAVTAHFGSRRSSNADRPSPERAALALFAAAPAITMAALVVLARDLNFLYLLHHLPWLSLAGAAGPVAVFRLLHPRWRRGGARLAGALGTAALVAIGGLGVRDYRRDTAPQCEVGAMPFEQVEALLARNIPEGALVIGTETSWLAARAARAQYVFARHYVQYRPSYARYPVHSTFEGSHLTSYQFDLSLLSELDAAGVPVFYVCDMWDWAWDVYAPFGRYAETYRDVRDVLDQRFTPVLRIFTHDRGWITLYRYGRPPGPLAPVDDVFVEGRPFVVGPDVPARRPSNGEPAVHPEVAVWDLDPEVTYWLHGEVAVDGGLAVPVWSGTSMSRFLDAAAPVPFDAIVHGTRQGRLSLVPYPASARVRVGGLALRALRPRP